MFMWMVHVVREIVREFELRKCLCECYTKFEWWIIKEFESRKCLCKCYTKLVRETVREFE
jgi:hypothetical protein